MVSPSSPEGSSRPLIEISPEVLVKLRQPRTLLAVVLVIAGAIAEVAGYWGVSGTVDPGEQLPYLVSGGIGGLFLLGAAAALFFSADLLHLKDKLAESTDLIGALADEIRELKAEVHDLTPARTGAPDANGTTPPRRRASGQRTPAG